VRVTDAGNLHFTSATTVEAWVYPTGGAGNFRQIVNKWNLFGSGLKSYVFQLLPDGRADFSACSDGDDGNATGVESTNTIRLNQWTHIAGTYDGAMLSIYVNGQYQASSAYPYGIFPGTGDLGIGGTVGGSSPGQVGYTFVGKLDEVSLYNRALADSEIQQI